MKQKNVQPVIKIQIPLTENGKQQISLKTKIWRDQAKNQCHQEDMTMNMNIG